MKLLLVSSGEEPPSSKRVSTMEDEGVEQLQTTALDSEDSTTAGEALNKMWYAICKCTCAAIHDVIPTVCLPLANHLGVCGYIP